MTLLERLLKTIELLKLDKKNCSKKWMPYRIQPIQNEVNDAKQFAKNFTNEDGTLCNASLAILFINIQNLERRIEELETEIREIRCNQEY